MSWPCKRLLVSLLARSFSPLLVGGRLTEIAHNVQEMCGAKTLLVESLDNIRYATGFTGSSATLIVRADHSVLITDGRYGHQARDQAASSGADITVIEVRSAAEIADAIVSELSGAGRCAFDPAEISVGRFRELQIRSDVEFVPCVGVIAGLRRSKSASEIERISYAAHTTDAALSDVEKLMLSVDSEVITERDVRDELEYRMRRHGADGPSYETIVATGVNGALPHHRPTATRLKSGDAVVIDVGALVDGYHSDMTRTFLLGDVDPVLSEMHALVLESQRAGVRAVRAGVLASDIDALCRSIISDAGYGPEFVHSTGHGVGLQIHESPWLRSTFNEPLRANEVVTVEPGVYRVGLGGVRIEDLLLVTATGSTTLTQFSKDNLCLQSQPMI